MNTTLALLYGPRVADAPRELRNLVAHASRVRDTKFKARHDRFVTDPGRIPRVVSYNRPKQVVGI